MQHDSYSLHSTPSIPVDASTNLATAGVPQKHMCNYCCFKIGVICLCLCTDTGARANIIPTTSTTGCMCVKLMLFFRSIFTYTQLTHTVLDTYW